METLGNAVRRASRALEAAGWDPPSAYLDAEVLARAMLGIDLAAWLARQGERADHAFQRAFDDAVARRLRYEPVAYIVGEREFYGRSFRVSPAVLIPRPETELVVDEALAAAAVSHADGRAVQDVADVGTGSGVLAVTLALELPDTHVAATDVSSAALAVAAANVDRFHLAARVTLEHAALLGDRRGAFDLVVSNPPYVAARDRAQLMPDVRDYEPGVALFGGADGLDVIRALLPAATRALRPGGWLVMELGAGQSAVAAGMLEESTGLSLVRIAHDLADIPRVVVARRYGEP